MKNGIEKIRKIFHGLVDAKMQAVEYIKDYIRKNGKIRFQETVIFVDDANMLRLQRPDGETVSIELEYIAILQVLNRIYDLEKEKEKKV